jgi:K+-transporting ATPase c subunit
MEIEMKTLTKAFLGAALLAGSVLTVSRPQARSQTTAATAIMDAGTTVTVTMGASTISATGMTSAITAAAARCGVTRAVAPRRVSASGATIR